MIYGYARVSTNSQKLDLQLNALKDCDKIYKEKVSGIKYRPELINLLADIKPGDTLKVYKLDRLGRSTTDLIKIVEYLKENNIGFISVSDNLDTTSAMGNMIFQIFAVFAEFERNLISERTKAGLQAAKERGVILGKPMKWTVRQVHKAKKLRKEGYSVNEISKKMRIPASTIYRLLALTNGEV